MASVSERLQSLSERLAQFKEVAGEHERLFRIRDECCTIEAELSLVLRELKDTQKENWDFTAHGKSRRWSSTRQALQHRSGKDLALLEKRLKDIRDDLTLSIVVELVRCDEIPRLLNFSRLIHDRAQQYRQGSGASSSQALESTRESAEQPPIGLQFLQIIDEKKAWQKELVTTLLDKTNALLDSFDGSAFDRHAAKHFLETLTYPEMYDRGNQVSYAFEETLHGYSNRWSSRVFGQTSWVG